MYVPWKQFSVDGVLVEELVSGTVDHHHVTEYDGRPCPLQRGPCRHGGRCVPRLNNFDCQCTAEFTGKLCQICTSVYVCVRRRTSLYDFVLVTLLTDF